MTFYFIKVLQAEHQNVLLWLVQILISLRSLLACISMQNNVGLEKAVEYSYI